MLIVGLSSLRYFLRYLHSSLTYSFIIIGAFWKRWSYADEDLHISVAVSECEKDQYDGVSNEWLASHN